MDLAILRCVDLHLCPQTSAEQSTLAISPPGLRRRLLPAPLRQPLALAPTRTIRVRDPPKGDLRTALEAAEKVAYFIREIFQPLVFRRELRFLTSPGCPAPGILPSRNTLLPALTPRELVSPSAPGWRRWPGSGKTNPLFWRRAASPAAKCCPACPSQTLSRSACVSSD